MPYLLSIGAEHVRRILAGEKRWEFRANPHFGRVTGSPGLAPGDTLFLVPDAVEITCFCTVGRILRSDELRAWFGEPATGRWREAGCAEGTERDFDFFRREILEAHATAVELERVTVLSEPIRVASIKRLGTGEPWPGRGFFSARDLRRYELGGEPLEQVLRRAAGLGA